MRQICPMTNGACLETREGTVGCNGQIIPAVTLFFCANCVAADFEVAGLKLGQPVVVQECKFSVDRGRKDYEIVSRTTCFRDVVDLGPGMSSFTIAFGIADYPSIIKSGWIGALTRNGILVAVDFRTHGIASQEL